MNVKIDWKRGSSRHPFIGELFTKVTRLHHDTDADRLVIEHHGAVESFPLSDAECWTVVPEGVTPQS